MKNFIRSLCMRTGRAELLLRSTSPDHFAWAEWLRKHRGIVIGEGTTVHPGAWFTDRGMVTIGRNCSVSRAEFITHSGGDRIIGPRWGIHAASARPIVVGDYCLIGAGARIMPGVTIGDDCVIAAGAHITRNVPAGSVMRPIDAVCVGTTRAYATRLGSRATEVSA